MAAHVVTGDQYVGIDRKMIEIKRQLLQGQGHLDPGFVDVILQRIIDRDLRENSEVFVSGLTQIANVTLWNETRGWEIPQSSFTHLGRWPTLPATRSTAVVLVPYLAAADGMTGEERTFIELCKVIYEQAGSVPPPFLEGRKLSLFPGVRHEVGLRWEVIDLGANRNAQVSDIRGLNSPHAGVLAAAAHHKGWMYMMDGDTVPFVNLPGYRVTDTSGEPFWSGLSGCPYLMSRRGTCKLDLDAHSDVSTSPSFATPVLQGVSPR